jgi:hypothetical protein
MAARAAGRASSGANVQHDSTAIPVPLWTEAKATLTRYALDLIVERRPQVDLEARAAARANCNRSYHSLRSEPERFRLLAACQPDAGYEDVDKVAAISATCLRCFPPLPCVSSARCSVDHRQREVDP